MGSFIGSLTGSLIGIFFGQDIPKKKKTLKKRKTVVVALGLNQLISLVVFFGGGIKLVLGKMDFVFRVKIISSKAGAPLRWEGARNSISPHTTIIISRCKHKYKCISI